MIWEEKVLGHPENIVERIEADYQEMITMVNRLDDYQGFQLIKQVKKNGVKMYILKEEG